MSKPARIEFIIPSDHRDAYDAEANKQGQTRVGWMVSVLNAALPESVLRNLSAKRGPGRPGHPGRPKRTDEIQAGDGWRIIDPKVDRPRKGDQFWDKSDKKWKPRPFANWLFIKKEIYRRLIEVPESKAPKKVKKAKRRPRK